MSMRSGSLLSCRAGSLGALAGRGALLGAFVALGAGRQVLAQPVGVTVTCSSKAGETVHCDANTSRGVVLARSIGESPCLLGKTWGYDDKGVWVADGCVGEFVVGRPLPEGAEKGPTKRKPLSHIPNVGFLLVDSDKGEVYVRLFSYVRYLNQKGLDSSYTDSFGKTHTVPQRQDVQLNKFFLPFAGWFLTPKF